MGPPDTSPVPRRGREEDPRRDAPRSSRDVLSAENREAPTLPKMVLFFPPKKGEGRDRETPGPAAGPAAGAAPSGQALRRGMLGHHPDAAAGTFYLFASPLIFLPFLGGISFFFNFMFILIFLLNTPEKAARCCPLRPVYL